MSKKAKINLATMKPKEKREQWKLLQIIFQDEKGEVMQECENEINVLTLSILKFEEQFVEDKKNTLIKNKSELKINFEDFIIKALDFIKFWDQKEGDEQSVMFLIQAIHRIVDNKIQENEELSDNSANRDQIKENIKDICYY
jgi:hypothetical protein